jgi:hypothetical protein
MKIREFVLTNEEISKLAADHLRQKFGEAVLEQHEIVEIVGDDGKGEEYFFALKE